VTSPFGDADCGRGVARPIGDEVGPPARPDRTGRNVATVSLLQSNPLIRLD
jgi:hypothetical protein